MRTPPWWVFAVGVVLGIAANAWGVAWYNGVIVAVGFALVGFLVTQLVSLPE